MEARRDVFQAIADPTRREILGILAAEPMNLNSIAENFDMSRQAISLHIRILKECGLISVMPKGRERFCKARLEKLNEVHKWTAKYQHFWEQKLDALGKFLDNESKTIKTKRIKPKKR